MKKLVALLLAAVMCFSIAACGSSDEDAKAPEPEETETPEVKEEPKEPEKPEETPEPEPEPVEEPEEPENTYNESGKVLLDNEFVTITLGDMIDEEYCFGYQVVIENKSDQYVLASIDNSSVDGVMEYVNFSNSTVNPGKKAQASLEIYADDLIDSADVLKNVEGDFRLSFNSDGGNSYTGGSEAYHFVINGNENGGIEIPTEDYTKLVLDNDLVRIVLGDTVEEDYYVGYKAFIENKSDSYLLVTTDNTSIDGFMEYMSLENSSVAPGKYLMTNLVVYTNDSAIQSVDQLKAVDGEFALSTNTDGGSSYNGNDQYHFDVDSAETITLTLDRSQAAPAQGDAAGETAEAQAPAAAPLNIGDTVTSEDWEITLTNAYTSDKLQSDESSTYWEAADGYAFMILELDVECLNSSKKPVDGDAIANPVATTSAGNTYESWEYQYIASQLWCYFMNTYLDANLPVHAYVYTNIPEKVMNDPVTVDVTLAGQDYTIAVN